MEEAIRDGNLQRVQELIRSGADVNAQCKLGINTMVKIAIILSHDDIALALLAAGADVHAKDEEGETALHWACEKKLEKVIQELIDRGSRVEEANRYGNTPLCYAVDNPAILMRLLRAGASCIGLSTDRVNELFRQARHEGDLLAVGTLLKNGCSVRSLSREERDDLLSCAYHEGDIFVARILLKARCSAGKLTHAQLVQLMNHLPKLEKEGLLHSACIEGDVLIVEALIAANCNVNPEGSAGDTPLMNAVREGHEEVVKKLILAGANLVIKDENGSTAFHYAAICNHIQCGVLLAEGGASVRTRNQFSETPLDLAKLDFQEAIKQALSFTTRKTLCIIGNAEGGKSTLITALKAESTGFLGRIFNRFRRVEDPHKRTAGIETVAYCSHRYGEVLFFDFAGQDDYHGPHQMFLESLLSKPGVSMTLLLVIKVTETEESILHQLHRWLTPVALMSTTASPPHVIVIGSFLDKARSKQEATTKLVRCIEESRSDLEALSLKFVGTCFLNCRQPQSEGIDQLCHFLQDIPIPEFRSTHTCYSLAWVLSKIRSSIKAQALQLQEFSTWIMDSKDNLPQTIPSPEEVCQDLSAAGHALYLPNREDPFNSWLVLDLPTILRDVYGTLFSRSQEIVQEFGLLHCRHLAKLFPDLDLAMVQQLLTSLEFCIPVDPSVLKVELSKLTQSEETSGWLFFPALVSTKQSQPTSGGLHRQSVLCWQLRTSKKHSISAHILQTILLRLAAHFVVKHNDEEGAQQHCCCIWWNGIAWSSTAGVHVTVHTMKNRVIQVIASGKMADRLCQYFTHVVSDILSTVRRLSPKLAAAAYIVHPPKQEVSPEDITAISPKELFTVEGIRSSIKEGDEFALSLGGSDWNMRSISDLFGEYTPTLETVERIVWSQPEATQLQLSTEQYQPQSPDEHIKTHPATELPVPSGAQALLNISSTPDMRDVDVLVVTSVAANWLRLALRLGVEGCVSEIVFKNHPNDYEGACRDMLGRWLRGERHTGEEERTWSALLTALGKAGFVDLERSLRREHFTKE